MKRIVLTAATCLSLLVAIPAVSAASSSGHHAGRGHRPDDPGAHRSRPDDRHRDRHGDRRDLDQRGDRDLDQRGDQDREDRTTIRQPDLRPSRGAAVGGESDLGRR